MSFVFFKCKLDYFIDNLKINDFILILKQFFLYFPTKQWLGATMWWFCLGFGNKGYSDFIHVPDCKDQKF